MNLEFHHFLDNELEFYEQAGERLPGNFLEHAIGAEILRHIKSLQTEDLLALVNQKMQKLFLEIIQSLEDETLDDPSCFHRIDAIVQAFRDRGVDLNRHDW